MKLGKFSGRFYSDEEAWDAQECCVDVPDNAKNYSKFFEDRRLLDLFECVFCMGCPRANLKAYNEENLKGGS